MYLSRAIKSKINAIKNEYAAITIYGARQVGKSTMVNNVFGQKMKSVSLDDLEIRALANTNPKLFLETYPWPIIIDEIKKADLIIEYPDHICPIEIKKGINPVGHRFNFDFLKNMANQFQKEL